jgi:hypothetical protein
MAPRDGAEHVFTSAASAGADSSARTEAGVEAYGYDPTLRLEQQSGLDRLRCVQDRDLATVLYKLYFHAERRARTPQACRAARPLPNIHLQRLRVAADRARAGELGSDARELAEYVLRDEAGRERSDECALREFGQALAKLQRLK